MRFPRVTGRTLLGAEVELPRDLPAERTLTLLAFQQRHQACVDRWIGQAVAAGVPPTPRGATGGLAVAVVEVPVLSTRWRVARRFIDGGMATGIGDPDVLARTITVYTDVGAVQRPLDIPGSDEVHALVVTRDGAVLAHESGEPTPTRWYSVGAALFP